MILFFILYNKFYFEIYYYYMIHVIAIFLQSRQGVTRYRVQIGAGIIS